jgi:hypothetical protein
MPPGQITAKVCMSDLLAPGLHGFDRAWFVGDVTTKVPMAAVLLGL